MAADLYLPRDVVVESVEDLTPYLRRVVLTGPDLDRVHPTTLDRRIKLVLPRAEGDTLPDLPRDARWYDAWRALPDATPPAALWTPDGATAGRFWKALAPSTVPAARFDYPATQPVQLRH